MNHNFKISVSLSDKEAEYLKNLELDNLGELNLDVYDEPPEILLRMVARGIIKDYVSDWGMQWTGYCISHLGEQIIRQIKSNQRINKNSSKP